jgi:SAM-dependent MidA family methyltransferase
VVSLAERLRERIVREGPISFRDFMAAALYDADEGYYTRGAAIGEPGDFVTSPTVSPLFAQAIARQFQGEIQGIEGPLDFVEVGAGDGRFLEAFSAALERQDPGFAARVKLVAVEPSGEAGRRLSEVPFSRPVRLLDTAEDLAEGSVRGWIFSNELFDALPVARIQGFAGGLRELRVGLEEGRFGWVPAPAPEAWPGRLAAFGVALAPGQAGELSLDAAPLYRHLARALARGALVTFDYGHRAGVLYHALARPHGTLAVHSAGRRGGDPLARPGQFDLTAHVNWDELAREGEAEGLVTRGIFRQGRYLAEAGLLDLAKTEAEKWRAYRLLDPEGMGEELSVLIQTRDV